MPLKNYSTRVPASRSVSEITRTLVDKGADQITTEYNDSGVPYGLRWALNTQYGRRSYALPLNFDKVFEVLTEQGVNKKDERARMKKAQMVAWRILKDWVEAQIAFIEAGMVSVDEVFLPYMLVGDRTVYDALVSGELRAVLDANRPAIALGAAGE